MSTLPPPAGPTYRICFVCTGNICRSPVAEVVMRRLLDDAGLADVAVVCSAGTGGWHEDDGADPRAVASLRAGGYDGSGHRARSFAASWFDDHDLVVALERGHLRALRSLARTTGQRDRVRLLRSFDDDAPQDAEVADPYYGDSGDFATVLDQVESACRRLLDQLVALLPRDRG